ncbi:hypothetical protein GCM10010339_93100 [Streptomyces alanosinicus]|uniref:OmpR/PhoB-type domain-containing protein n=2 Tax=Streptomyces alanosinicus TaxID=68171 RepID=A0A918YW50_9ACTN|nr:hypothetical protein GCM10010339_93100 [Streptomyces alanosinicus]
MFDLAGRGIGVLEFRLLGTVSATSAKGELQLAGYLQQSLLAALLIAEGKAVSRDYLIDEIWGGDPPNGVENAVQAHVSRLRRKLSAIEEDPRETRLTTQNSGYRLLLDGARLDISKFLEEYERLKSGVTGTDRSAPEIRRILTMWQGPMYGGAMVGQACQAVAAHIDEVRLALWEFLFDCDLEHFEHRRIIPELQALLVEHPYNERFRQQLMVALYRSGRQTEALDVYRGLHSQLSEDLGLAPSPAMREYERAVLEQDPSLHILSTLPLRARHPVPAHR